MNKIKTEHETIHAINKLKADKSPGEDGLTGEFYKSFKDVIIKPLTEIINSIWIQGNQPPSHKNALIKLLYKKEDHRKLKNWRPISLLNIDYKIYTKILTERLKKLMDKITPPEQKGGVEGRG